MKKKILNLTLHEATPEQRNAGVVESEEDVSEFLVFDSLPTKEEIKEKARKIAELTEKTNVDAAMIGGAPYLMSSLERELKDRGIAPVYAFSKRESVEKTEGNEVVKTQVFRHMGFVEVE